MRNLYFIVALSITMIGQLCGQDYNKIISKAEKATQNYNFEKANCLYKKASFNDTMHAYIQYKIGKNYYEMNQYEEALPYFESAKPFMKDSIDYNFDLYHLYSMTGYSTLAKAAYMKYVNLCKSCVKKDLMPGSSSNKLIYKKPENKATVMGYESSSANYFPYIINDNQVQYLSKKLDRSKRTNALHLSQYLTVNYTNADFMFYNVNEYDQIHKYEGLYYGPFSLNKELDKIYITRWDTKNNRMFLYFSKKEQDEDLGWEKYSELKIELDNGLKNFVHPMFSADQKQLIFASDIEGGLGGYDLWIGDIEENTSITNIKNLGTYINTPGDELFPSVYNEDLLFFASNGHYGFGNLDQYVGVITKGKYRKSVNLGTGFNTEYDDYSLFYNKKKDVGFFTSNRFLNSKEEKPFDRIYTIKFNPLETTIDVQGENKTPISGALVTIPSQKIKETTGADGVLKTYTSSMELKKVIVTSDHYTTIDTFLSPFEDKLTVTLKKKMPSDYVSFALTSTPSGKEMANINYVLTSLADNQQYKGITDYNGIGNVSLYANEKYKIEVPQFDFVQSDIMFDGIKIQNFSVTKDIEAPRAIVKTSPEIEENKVIDGNFTLYYHSDNWTISNNEEAQIKFISEELTKNPTYKVKLASHTDCQGDVKYNKELSKKRGTQVANILKSRGIAASQIVNEYFGESQPYNDCKCDEYDNYNCSSDKFKMNRRTEVRLIK